MNQLLTKSINQDEKRRPTWRDLPVWDLAFRPGFLLASTLSLLAIGYWLLLLNGIDLGLHLAGLSAVTWHVHEMLFGFAATVAMAFVLTAVQTWTGLRSIHGLYLITLTALWIISRLVIWAAPPEYAFLLFISQGCWWLLGIGFLAKLLISARSRRNYVFIPIFTLIAAINLWLITLELNNQSSLALHLAKTAILGFGLLISLIGGRVIPMFSNNAIAALNIAPTPRINWLLIALSPLGIAAYFFSELVTPPFSPAALMIAVGALHLIRLSHWRSWKTIVNPLLWSLHLTYLTLSIGLLLLGLSYYLESLTFSSALHVITIGAIGGMIISMMSRVSLGHTGRPLKTSIAVSISLALLPLAALIRLFAVQINQPIFAWNISGLFWLLAMMIFITCYFPILTGPRRD